MKHLKTVLAVWGGVSAALLITVVGYLLFKITLGNVDRHNEAQKEDVRFVLNWCELGEGRIQSVLHSFESSRSMTGDHLDAYAINISGVSIKELENPPREYIKWTRGDRLRGELKDAVELALSFVRLDELDWFPKTEEIFSDEIYVNPWTILLHGNRVTSAQLIFASPGQSKIYYASVKI